MLLTLIATAVVLGVLVFVHELGHFVTAKIADIEVPRFSIGLGPKAWGFTYGETEYVLSWVPLGGYVRMAGMEELEAVEGGADEEPRPVHAAPGPRDFDGKPVGTRAIVISAGVIMNMLFAFLTYAAMAVIWGVGIQPDARLGRLAEDLPPGVEALGDLPLGTRIERVGNRDVSSWRDVQNALALSSAGPTVLRLEGGEAVTVDLPADDEERGELIGALSPAVDPVVGMVLRGEPAEAAGVRVGDRVLEVDGERTEQWEDMVEAVSSRPGETIALVVERDGRRETLRVTPEPTVRVDADGDSTEIGLIGIGLPVERPGPLGALAHGARETWRWTAFTIDVLQGLITGGVSARSVGGPILIGQLSGQVARAGIEPLLAFMALLSINLAVFNLLPIPILDGGQLVFLAVEAIRGKGLSLEQRIRFSQVGMVVLMALIVLVMANDILRLLGI